MEIGVHGTRLIKSVARGAAALALMLTVGGPTSSFAGDVSAQPANTLNITGSTAGILPQPSAERGWFSDFHVSGFVSQTFGMWQNPEALRDFTLSRNNLAVSRTWLQVDENWRLNESNSFFAREWFVYEPPYAFNSANNGRYAAAETATLKCLTTNVFGTRPCPPLTKAGLITPRSGSFGHFMNDFYNRYDVRDFWWENKTGPLTTYIGNQIIVWGQSIAFRVGDLINPTDTTWAFGFSNLEQSRLPQWMIHPILNLPEFGPFTSNFLEAVIDPRYQPQWNFDYADGRDLNQMGVSGSISQGFPAAHTGPSTRFDVHNLIQYYPGRTACANPATAAGLKQCIFGPHLVPTAGKNGLFGAGLVPIQPSAEFFYCTNLGSAKQPFNPIPAGLQKTCWFHSDGNVGFGGVGNGAALDAGKWSIPAATVSNWEEAMRFHTLFEGTELTAFYMNWWNPYPSIFWQKYTNQFRFRFIPLTTVGVTADRPVPLPDWLTEYAPVVGRAEVVYANHQPYADFDYLTYPTGVRYSDTVNMMYALDLDQAFAPWLTATGNLSANFEFLDYIALDSSQNMRYSQGPYGAVGGRYPESNNKHDVQMLLNVGTSWWWGDFVPTWTMLFAPKGRTFLLFPSLVLNPPWTKKYFLKLQAIEVMGGDIKYGGGNFKGESLLTAQFQYNFELR
jgi:hypothetical protein